MNKELQLNLELLYAENNTNLYIKSRFLNEGADIVTPMVKAVDSYLENFDQYEYTTSTGTGYRHDLVEIHDVLSRTDLDKVYWVALTMILTQESITIQQLVGAIIGFFKQIEQVSRKLTACEIVLTALMDCPAVTFEITKGDSCIVKAKRTLNQNMKDEIANQDFVLPMVVPPETVRHNNEIGYLTVKESILCGGPLKHHDKDVALDHINRVNAVPYSYETRLHELTGPVFNPEPKVKGDGNFETEIEVQRRYQAFNQLHDTLPHKLALLYKHGNKFYMCHRYDSRLRTYVKAHHFNYQGTKFLKAMVQFHDQEVALGEW